MLTQWGTIQELPLKPTPPTGLDVTEAARRLALHGPNRLDTTRPRTAWHMALNAAREPMFQLLAAAGLLYLLLGDAGEAWMLLALVGVSVGISVVQGQRTEQALQALRYLASPRAVVVRGGVRVRISGHEVVQGDLLVLSEGDRVAADAWLLGASNLRADESLLTGEAVPVDKVALHHATGPVAVAALAAAAANAARRAGQASAMPPGGNCPSLVYAGTLLVGGHGLAQVLATGSRTEMGRIGHALADMSIPPTPLMQQTRHLVRLFATAGLGLSVVVLLLYGLTRGDWVAGSLAAITLAMSMLPEEFLLILTVFMAMGAWRLSYQRVLTRRAATIEALGAATVLCTDKTGTLTQNRMAVTEMVLTPTDHAMEDPAVWQTGDGVTPVPRAFHALLRCGVLASEPEPFDAMDRAILALSRSNGGFDTLGAGCKLVHDHGLDPQWRVMTHVWRCAQSGVGQVALKGAHESVVALCRLEAPENMVVCRWAEDMAMRGLRVLAVAQAEVRLPDERATPWTRSIDSYDFRLLGLVGLEDPLRPGVPAAVRECQEAGIRVVMITGDHPGTAMAMARRAGLDIRSSACTGTELNDMDDAALRLCLATTHVFARVLPEQKLRIVEALMADGHVVAMTGDGVNDAPSLKAAHIGVAMGLRGTDVAREASSLVLLDDDFGSIVSAVRLGRRIYDNLVKAMAFAFAVHVPIAGLSLLPLLLELPVVFSPIHIAFLELLIDPVCSIVFESEPEEGQVMSRPPRKAKAPLFSWALVVSSLLQGAVVLAATACLFMVLLHLGVGEAQARAATFAALVACSVVLILTNRSLSGNVWAALCRPNLALAIMVAATACLMGLVLLVPVLRGLFRFEPLTLPLFASAMFAAAGVLVTLEATGPIRFYCVGGHND